MFKFKIKFIIFVSIFLLSFSFLYQNYQPASSLSGSQFNRGNIISDSLFYRKSSMSVATIQQFLNSKVPSCDTNGTKAHWSGGTRAAYGRSNGSPPPYYCLKSHKMSNTAKPAESGLCSAIPSASSRTAAQIIFSISTACGIDAKVLLVMLQKEQGLITDDWPWPIQYRVAMGYDCPDSGPNYSANCSDKYSGFFNQVYNAARQFKNYRKNPSSFSHRAGRVNYIQYNPNPACGEKAVYIENFATAGLYNYTPYTPNAATLDADFGEEAPCGAYGNKNFWWLYNIWFGNTKNTLSYRLIECGSQEYLVERGIRKKRLLTPQTIAIWDLSEAPISVSDPGCSYPTYNKPLDRALRSRSTKKVYFGDLDKAYLFHSPAVSRSWGMEDTYSSGLDGLPQLNGSTIHDLSSAVIKVLPRIAQSDNTSKSYLIDGGKRYLLMNSPTENYSLRLFRGTQLSTGVFSAELLSSIPSGGTLDFAFKSQNKWFVADHGVVRQITPEELGRWENIIDDSPTLSEEILGIFPVKPNIGKGFKRGDTYYRVTLSGDIQSTTNIATAETWGAYNGPVVSNLLRNKLSVY